MIPPKSSNMHSRNKYAFAQYLKNYFSLGVMANVKTLTDLEVSFINEHFDGVSFESDYCSVFFDGNYEELEAILQNFLAINSASFVTVENHSKDKNNKRFTQAGRLASFNVQKQSNYQIDKCVLPINWANSLRY